MSKDYSASQVIDAIKGSGGIYSTIAARLGCDWATARAYVGKFATATAAYAAERETLVDAAESVLVKNVQLAQRKQATGDIADTSDAKWILSRLGKDRGYVERSELTGKDGEPLNDTAALIAAMRQGAADVHHD